MDRIPPEAILTPWIEEELVRERPQVTLLRISHRLHGRVTMVQRGTRLPNAIRFKYFIACN